MLSIIVGIILIVGGLLWCAAVALAGGMASRPLASGEMLKPLAWGVGFIILGVCLIIYR